jgi:hypothetical protein
LRTSHLELAGGLDWFARRSLEILGNAISLKRFTFIELPKRRLATLPDTVKPIQ